MKSLIFVVLFVLLSAFGCKTAEPLDPGLQLSRMEQTSDAGIMYGKRGEAVVILLWFRDKYQSATCWGDKEDLRCYIQGAESRWVNDEEFKVWLQKFYVPLKEYIQLKNLQENPSSLDRA